MACDELGLSAEPKAISSKLLIEELPISPVAKTCTGRLISIHSLTHVNKLATGHRLEFGPQLTIVYGSNGSGKSGYARVLKSACRCNERAVEKILPNVYDVVASGPAGAAFELESNGTTRTLAWQEAGTLDPELHKYAVFDSKAARSYLRERNILPLTPSVFVRLELFGDAVRQIKERLISAATNEQPLSTALSGFIDQSKFGQAIAGITAATDHEKLVRSLVWGDTDQALLEDQELQLATLKTKGPDALKRELQQRRTRLRTLAAKLSFAENVVAAQVVISIKESSIRCRDFAEQKKAAAKLALGESAIAGVGSVAWESLIRSAAAFFEETQTEEGFPGAVENSKCVLCHQVLSAAAHERLKRFWAFLLDEAAQKLKAEEDRMKKLLIPLDQITPHLPPELDVLKEHLAIEVPSIWGKVPAQFEALSSLKNSILVAVNSGDWSQLKQSPEPMSSQCEAEIAMLVQKESDLGDTAKAAKELKERMESIAELLCRKKAHAGREILLNHYQKLVKSTALRTAAESISTLGISNKTSALQKKYVVEAFATQVKQCAKELGLNHAIPGITSRTEAGKVSQTVMVHGANVGNVSPESVFSEGERTALALAYFFAELGAPSDTYGVVFDDPVTSLDHRIRTKVSEKIAGLAAGRQVVVFTHDLAFFCELRDVATRTTVGLELRSIETMGATVGLIRGGEPWDAMGVTDREQVLEMLIRDAKGAEAKADTAGYSAICFQFYGRLRSTWERAVEELIFNKVVLRFDKAVKTQRLTGVAVDATVIAEVFVAMTKCSGYIEGHDHAAAANITVPEPTEMRADLDAIRAFRAAQKKRNDAQVKLLSHLK